MEKSRGTKSFVLCIENTECDDLAKGKVYSLLRAKPAAKVL